ncbi:6-phosphogluconate dehydrogenase, NAD(+)-dependent, decarboxylating [compost metagenome]
MKLGMIGLGKMGYHLVLNLLQCHHEVVAYDMNRDSVENAALDGAIPAFSVEEFISSLPSPRIVWIMVPAGKALHSVIDGIAPLLNEGDIIIDGGNSYYKDSLALAEKLEKQGIHFFDVGTSGGINGAEHGGCFMIGGNEAVFRKIEPIFKDIAVDKGYLYAGPTGSGHFLKMVHNGIEYGMMQAIAEGFEILDKSPFDFNYEEVARVWSNGSVIRGWLMELTENAFSKDAKLDNIRGVMHSSGEGKWTVEAALDFQAAAPVIAMSLFMRYRSLDADTFHGKVVAALRNEFGGHAVESK